MHIFPSFKTHSKLHVLPLHKLATWILHNKFYTWWYNLCFSKGIQFIFSYYYYSASKFLNKLSTILIFTHRKVNVILKVYWHPYIWEKGEEKKLKWYRTKVRQLFPITFQLVTEQPHRTGYSTKRHVAEHQFCYLIEAIQLLNTKLTGHVICHHRLNIKLKQQFGSIRGNYFKKLKVSISKSL